MPKTVPNTSTLRRILQQQLAIGKRLETLAVETAEAIVLNDVTRLSAIGAEQRQCVSQQATLEESRMAAARELAWAMGCERVPTLSELLPLLPTREQEPLNRLRLQILETATRLNAQNERNRVLLDNAIDIVRFTLDLVTTTALRPARYGTNLAALAAPTFYIDSKA